MRAMGVRGISLACGLVWLAGFSQAESPVIGKYDGQIYGYVHLNLAYDTHATKLGNYVLYVNPESEGNHDNELNITANQTRLGYTIKGPEVSGAKTQGQIETDFYGGGAENKSTIMLRHAFMEISWPESGVSLLAGQTWDLIETQNPNTVNFSVLWDAGNIGYRRPQLRVSKIWNLEKKSSFTAKAALARDIGRANTLSPRDTGEDAGVPVVEASLRYAMPLLTAKPAEFGLAGHWGQEDYDTAANGSHDTYLTWSGRLDLQLPLTDMIGLQLTAWKGSNLENYMGGIGQGINLATKQSITAMGGYAAVAVGPCNLGTGFDVPEYDQLAAGSRQQNSSTFLNVFIPLHEAVKVGAEISYWRTLYKESDDGEAVRGQVAFIYGF